MNELLSTFSDPSKFSTDDSFLPKATIPRRNHDAEKLEQERHLEIQRREQELLLFNSTEHQKEQRLLRQKQHRTTENEKNAQFGSLFVRFVRARLQHLQLHVLQKMLGVYVSDQELSTAEQFLFSVEQETSELFSSTAGSANADIAGVDEAFQSILIDMSKRCQKEKHASGKFAADTWYGALCHQVDDHAKLLVDFRSLQNENSKLIHERDELKAIVAKSVLEQQTVAKRNLEEKQATRVKIEMQEGKPAGRTAKLTLDLAMRDAEKRGENGTNSKNNNNSVTTDEESSQQNAELAKSLRLQDELTVLRKSSHTLQLALSRIQHRYNLLLKEHEELKGEIRNVISQQDAEEADIRRIFIERERDFDVATKRIQQLERELMTTSRKLDLAKSMRSRTDDEEKSNNNSTKGMMNSSVILANVESSQQQPSLVDRMTKLRGETVGKMQVAFSPSFDKNNDKNNEEGNNNNNNENLQQPVLKTEFSGFNKNNKNEENTNKKHDDEIFDEETPQDVYNLKNTNNNNNNTRRRKQTTSSNYYLDEDTFIADVGTMTEDPSTLLNFLNNNNKKSSNTYSSSPPVTVGTQTFFRNSASSSLAALQQQKKNNQNPNHHSALEHSLQQALDEQISKNQQQEKYLIDMEVKLDKIVRTMNKQCNVVEKFMDEHFGGNNKNSNTSMKTNMNSNNIIFLKQDFQNLLKRFGIPFNSTENSSSTKTAIGAKNPPATTTTTSSSSFQQLLFRAPIFSSSSPVVDPTPHDEEILEKVLDQIDQAMEEARRLERVSDQECQTDESSNVFSGKFMMDGNNINNVIDGEGGDNENDPLLAHLRKTSSMTGTSKNNKNFLPGGGAKDIISPPSSFWNATEAVNALKRVYVDAGRLIDTVETEAEVMMKFERDEFLDHHQNDDDEFHHFYNNEGNSSSSPFSPIISVDLPNHHRQRKTTTNDPSTENFTPTARHHHHHKTPQQLQQELLLRQQNRNKQQQQNFEQIATEQFFAIRALESSCKLLVQRLGYAKEDYVKRFYDRSSLLNQTLGNVSRTHPREANKLSRLAKTVQQARSVVPWMTGVASRNFSDFVANPHQFVDESLFQQQQETMIGASSSSTTPLQFKASEIVMGKSTTATATPNSMVKNNNNFPGRPSSAASPGFANNVARKVM